MEEIPRFTKFIKSFQKSEIIFEKNTPGDETVSYTHLTLPTIYSV